MTKSVMLGADPEVFLMIGDKFVSAAGMFPGTKHEPHSIDKGAVQVDGNALEFNIHAAANEDEFEGHIKTVLTQLDEMVKLVDKDMRIVFTPVATFEKDYWDNKVPLSAKELGCDPDFDFAGQMNRNPAEVIYEQPVRTAAGHIHIGWEEGLDPGNKGHFADCVYIAKKFHISGLFQPKTNEEQERLKYYGMNGAFRPKSYGVELRSPSNLWVAHEDTRRQMYRDVRQNFRQAVGL